MKRIEVVYSPLCEANGAFIGQLKEWLADKDVQVAVIPFDRADKTLGTGRDENCFIDVFCNGIKIDSVPLRRERIYAALGIKEEGDPEHADAGADARMSAEDLRHLIACNKIEFLPITRENYLEELSMCLCNYPFGNPPSRFHTACIDMKSKVFEQVWETERLAGVYAKYAGKVIGLLEAMPRELLKKYGYMTGTHGKDADYLTVGCYEVGRGIPRTEMLDALMRGLVALLPRFSRQYIEGVGISGCEDGFNPRWVFEKYAFQKEEELNPRTAVLARAIRR